MTRTYLFASLACLLIVSRTAGAQTATDIVAATDKIRNPQEPFRSTITLTEYVSGRERGHDTLAVFSKQDPATGQFRNLVQYVEPARDAGKRVLLDGRSLWFYDPASKTSVRISPQQRLIGQAAIGDAGDEGPGVRRAGVRCRPVGDGRVGRRRGHDERHVLGRQVGGAEHDPARDTVELDERQRRPQLVARGDQHEAPAQLLQAAAEAGGRGEAAQGDGRLVAPERARGRMPGGTHRAPQGSVLRQRRLRRDG